MKRSKVLTLLLTLMAALVLLSTSVLATDANGDGYHDGDVAIVREIIKNNKWLSEHYDINDPADWTEEKAEYYSLVVWYAEAEGDPMQVLFLDISSEEDTRPIGITGELDVSDMTGLMTLWCQNNPGITAVKLPKEGVLGFVRCDGTGITSIDVSGHPDLNSLLVADTGITELDVSKNGKLETLHCYNTGLTSLDVSRNTALMRLSCKETDITELELSNNPALTELVCSDTGITELDLTKNPALTRLECSNTDLTTLDLSKNTAMQYLECPDTPLTKIITSIGTLTIKQTEGGTLKADFIDFATGKASVTEKIEDGYHHDGWDGIPAGAEDGGTTITFPMEGDVTASAMRHKHKYILRVENSLHELECTICEDRYELDECPGEDYTDLDMSKWYHPYTDNVLWAGHMQGSSNTVFAPNDTLSRAMLAQILYNMEGKPEVSGKDSFPDTDEDSWYTKAILWASQNEIVNGYGTGSFGPNDPVTREQMVTMFQRYAKLKGYDLTKGSIESFDDADQVSNFAFDAMKWAVGKGLINGTGSNRLSPLGQSSRAEAAAVITRFVEKIAD